MYRAIIFAAVCGLVVGQDCTPSATTASGSFAPQGTICSGQIIFQEEFDSLNFQKWEHENTLGGGGVSIVLYIYIIFIICILCIHSTCLLNSLWN